VAYCCVRVSGLLAEGDLDERAMDAIKEFPAERALDVLAEFRQGNLEHVSNKSAFLCSIMKANRQKIKGGSSGAEQAVSAQRRPGPDDAKIKVSRRLSCAAVEQAFSTVASCCRPPVDGLILYSVSVHLTFFSEAALVVLGLADVQARVRVRKGWNKFRQLVPVLTKQDVSLLMRGKLYTSCVFSCMLHGSEKGQ